jgi:hypothetical protein
VVRIGLKADVPLTSRKLDSSQQRTWQSAGSTDGGDSLPYVVRLSEPPTPHERLQLAACPILRHPIAVMTAKCLTVEEWSERYGRSARS